MPMTRPIRRVGVIGAGVSGLAAARALSSRLECTLFEAGSWFGGHAHTVDLQLDGRAHGVDTGFLVYNAATYPQLVTLFEELGIETAASDMSFSVQAKQDGIEWSGSSRDTVFAQRCNLLRPKFWQMLAEIARFNRLTTSMAESASVDDDVAATDRTVGEFLARHRFSDVFRDWYFLPMVGCIWSCPTEQMLEFPMATMLRFCHNHGLLRITGRPPWRTVRGGSRRYVEKMIDQVPDARLHSPVRRVRRLAEGGVEIATDAATERFDAVVMACHSDQALALLADASAAERSMLGAVRWHANRAVLHTDIRVLPKRRRAWAAWNFERAANATGGASDSAPVCLHYLINRLQPLPFAQPVIVSLNPIDLPAAASVHGEFHYAHPIFDGAAIAAQHRLPALQGIRDTWFCGAWTRYGFHEDGLVSGLGVAEQIVARSLGAPMQSLEAAPEAALASIAA